MSSITLNEIKFKYICDIMPELVNGAPREFMPQSRYANLNKLRLHKYGHGPFCRFRIPRGTTTAGVYAVTVDGILKYIGECEDLEKRFNQGYGTIYARNCFQGGRQTNCRINMLILGTYERGSSIRLYFHEVDRRFELEKRLIAMYQPEWNIGR